MSKPNHKYQFFPFVGQMEDTKLLLNQNEINDIQYSNAILYPSNPYSKSKLKRKRRLDKILDSKISIKRLQRLKDSLPSDLMNVDKENADDNKIAAAAEPQSIKDEDQNNTIQSLKSTSGSLKKVIFLYNKNI